jgi:hypothetical protein
VKTLLRGAIAAAFALTLAACATVVSAPAGAYKLGDAYQVTLGHEWSDASGVMFGRPKHVRLLTTDGPLLNRLYLVDGLAPGDFMVRPAAKERPTPTYRTGMAPTELVELVADSVSALDYQRVETANLRPGKFAGADGLRFDISAATKEGLEMAGTAEVAEVDGKLYVILYVAPKEHYFGAGLGEIEQIMASARRG